MKNSLPIQDCIEKGIKKLNEKSPPEETLETLLVSIGAPKLISCGYSIKQTIKNPEIKLYDYLSRYFEHNRVHSAYNAYIRRLVSFERALQCVKKPKLKK